MDLPTVDIGRVAAELLMGTSSWNVEWPSRNSDDVAFHLGIDFRQLREFRPGERKDRPSVTRNGTGLRGEPTIADAVLDRIVHNAYRIDLKGESQRKRNKPPPLDGGNDK